MPNTTGTKTAPLPTLDPRVAGDFLNSVEAQLGQQGPYVLHAHFSDEALRGAAQ